jgi:hypothetical protein
MKLDFWPVKPQMLSLTTKRVGHPLIGMSGRTRFFLSLPTSHSCLPRHNVIAESLLYVHPCFGRWSGGDKRKGRRSYDGAPGF